jgi:predicted nucleic acid-binding protein
VIVADANLLLAAVVASPRTPLAESVLRRDRDWHAPRLWQSEARNAMARMARLGMIPRRQAEGAYARLDQIMAASTHNLDGMAVLRCAIRGRISAYDAEYVVLAQTLGVPLVTSDEEVLAAFPRLAVRPEVFAP